MAANTFLRRAHRVIAALFLVSMVPAGIVTAQGDAGSPLVYAPLPFLFGLIITGTYLLARPWVRQLQARRTSRGHAKARTEP